MGTSTRDFFRQAGMPAGDLTSLPSSTKRFPDGAQYRIEIPSTEGPECLEAVLDEASQRGVTVHRVSQGSGVMLQTDDELAAMARKARAAQIEVSLATRPNAAWGTSAMARASAGAAVGASARGQDEVAYQLQDARRAAAHGFRSVLITDVGTMAAFGQMRKAGILPASMQAKISVLLPLANPFAARVAADLGASTLNIPTDLTLPQIAANRAAIDIPLDVYVESANELGGFVRSYEVPELIRIAAPVYLKFGIRNAPDVYPSGLHVQATAVLLSRERVRRAQMVLELIARETPTAVMSAGGGAAGLALVDKPSTDWLTPEHAKEVLPLLVGDR